MLGEIFYWVFNMSISAAVCGIPIVLLRRIKRIPRRVSIWLWLIPFIRMCIPFGISSQYGLMAWISKFTTKTVPVFGIGDGPSFTMTNHMMGADSYFPITYRMNFLEKLFQVASVVWMTVSVLAILVLLLLYGVTMGEIRDARRLRDNIYVSDRIKVPSVYGIVKPRILLPCAYPEKDIPYILMHEKAHIKRGDNLIRIAALAVVCLHWFNPFAWLFLKMLDTDIELACDETVLLSCSEVHRKAYARALLSATEQSRAFSSSFGGARIRIRIENILSYRKISTASAIAFAALLLSVAYALLTNAP